MFAFCGTESFKIISIKSISNQLLRSRLYASILSGLVMINCELYLKYDVEDLFSSVSLLVNSSDCQGNNFSLSRVQYLSHSLFVQSSPGF